MERCTYLQEIADSISQLAVDLALRFNGEIINGDAMQLYDGLPIITNKVSAHERRGVPHHLLGCVGLHEPTWAVGNFVTRATAVVSWISAASQDLKTRSLTLTSDRRDSR